MDRDGDLRGIIYKYQFKILYLLSDIIAVRYEPDKD